MLIDSHCHLDYWSADELPGLMERARAAGVGELVSIGTNLDQSRKIMALVADLEGIWCTVGIHPHQAAQQPPPDPEALAALADQPKVVGIGEAGLDYFYDKAPRDIQQEVFRRHIRAARLAGLPICIHTRDADADTARILSEERDAGGDFDFLLHCFSSGSALAEKAVAMGGYVSFSGILTFPKSEDLRAVAADLPAERLLVETDAPYLAPVPNRGKRNEPAWVAHTAAVLARVRGLEPAALATLTTENFRRLFRRARPA